MLICCSIYLSTSITAQISSTDTMKSGFADYLFNLKMYDFAAEEYERLLFKDPDNVSYIKNLIKSYRFTGQAGFLTQKLDQEIFNDAEILNAYFKLLITENFNAEAKDLLTAKADFLNPGQFNDLSFQLALANKNWSAAKALFSPELHQSQYSGLMSSLDQVKYKKPGLAAGLSTIIPGLGRFYAKDSKDGIISLIFVGTTAYQAYRRFDQKGIKSAGGWIYGGIALGFYISNIYGSYQSAKYYNNKIDTALHEKSLYHINADLDL